MLGILYDIHGNLPALDRVLQDAEDLDLDRWLLDHAPAIVTATRG